MTTRKPAKAKKIPVSAAQGVADAYGLRQVILMCWDGQESYCVTYGMTVLDADQAALGGDRIKQALGWPLSTIGHLPSRVERIEEKLQAIMEAGQRVVDDWDIDVPDYTPNVERLRQAIQAAPQPCTDTAALRQEIAELRAQLREAEHRAETAEAYYHGPGLGQ